MNYLEATAPEMVKEWKRIVNNNVTMGRDAHLLKTFLLQASSAQILRGMYRYQSQATISIPQFLRQSKDWLIEDESWCEVELAIKVSNTIPDDYWIYMDFKDEDTPFAYSNAQTAIEKLREWAKGVLS